MHREKSIEAQSIYCRAIRKCEVDVMREQKYHVYLTAEEQSRVIQSLIRLKNELLEQGKYTDAVDDVLCKVLSAKKKRKFFI
mgnify:CR=1 FL=1